MGYYREHSSRGIRTWTSKETEYCSSLFLIKPETVYLSRTGSISVQPKALMATYLALIMLFSSQISRSFICKVRQLILLPSAFGWIKIADITSLGGARDDSQVHPGIKIQTSHALKWFCYLYAAISKLLGSNWLSPYLSELKTYERYASWQSASNWGLLAKLP